MRECLAQQTLIQTKVFYSIHEGKKIFYDEEPFFEKEQAIFSFKATLQPPLLAMPSTWKRYNLSQSDIRKILDKIDSGAIWQLSLILMFGNNIDDSKNRGSGVTGAKSTFQSLFSFLFASRKAILSTFYYKFIIDYSNPGAQVSCLCTDREDHIPYLPKIFISNVEFRKLQLMVPQRLPSFIWCARFSSCFTFKDIEMVPIEYDEKNKCLTLTRILTIDVLNEWKSHNIIKKNCVITTPVQIFIQDKLHILSDESCFAFCESKKRKIV